MKPRRGLDACVAVFCLSLTANALALAPDTGPAQDTPGHSPLNSRDEVRQTQPPRQGYYQDIPRRDGDYRRWQAGGPGQRPGGDWPGRPSGHGDGWGGGPHYRPGQHIERFPERYWKIPYRGDEYFYSGGYWYRPYGNAYVVVTPPRGVRVEVLPDYAQEVWLGGRALFVVADTYYQYLPGSGEYVVVDPAAPAPGPGGAAMIDPYPLSGQSPEQQQQDRYQCYRWAVSQTGFDPASAGYAPAPSVLQDYQQALGSCLASRGYRLDTP